MKLSAKQFISTILTGFACLSFSLIFLTPNKVSANDIGYINYYPGYGVALYNAPSGGVIPGRYMASGSAWQVLSISTDGQYFELGSKQWIKSNYMVLQSYGPQGGGLTFPMNKVAKINYVPGYGIAVYIAPRWSTTGQRLMHGTSWRISAVTIVNDGQTWYCVGSNQWVPGKYLKF